MERRNRIARWWRFLFADSARAFGTLSAALLLCLAVVPAKDYFREWTRYQNGYLNAIRARGDAASLERRFRPGIEQIWLPEIGAVDRCGTCHLGLKEASLAGAAQPFRPHPPIPHSLTEFGCVMCHRGQGPATSFEDAHRGTLAWEQPILPARYLEASCGQCHANALLGTPRLNLGRQLLARYDCAGCHEIAIPGGAAVSRGTPAPPLKQIASKTTREWIFAWLKHPEAYAASPTMPNFQFSDADARDVSAFLIAQSSSPAPGGDAKAGPAAAPDMLQQGQSLYGESFCASCHAIQNAAGILVGGNLGPELTRAGSKVNQTWLAAWLRDPKAYDPATRMPRYRFDEKRIALLGGYLGAQADSGFTGGVHLDRAKPAEIAHGKTIATERGCAACHEINGLARPDNFAPELTLAGSRPLSKIVFAEGVPHALPDYFRAKIRNPRSFGSAMKMPQYVLTDADIDALGTALLAQTGQARIMPAAMRVPGVAESSYRPVGKAGQLMDDMNCLSCHRIDGRGGDLAPDLSWEGSAVQRTWLVDFMQHPNTLRPALIRRMPKFNVTAGEAGLLADYIMTAYQTPAFDRDSLPRAGFTSAEVEQGKQLYYSKYVCQSCHILDPDNDKGYVGPTLTHVGERLNPAWIFHWLKDPQALRPGTMEPNRHMSDGDARALTAFLSSPHAGGGRAANGGTR